MTGLAKYVSRISATLFAIALIDASIIGALAVSLATAYAVGDVLALKHSLHRPAWDARGFYIIYHGLIGGAALLVLIPGFPLGLITEAVQTLAGILLPSATVFPLLLCNDKAVLGPWVNGRWTNLFTGVVIATLVILPIVLTASVLYPSMMGRQIVVILGGCAIIAGGVTKMLGARHKPTPDHHLRPMWRMPPLPQLAPASRPPAGVMAEIPAAHRPRPSRLHR